jgi:hypothetical protein
MPEVPGKQYITGESFGGFPTLTASEVARDCAALDMDTDWLRYRPTSYSNPLGPSPGTGSVLMRYGDYSKLSQGSDYSLVIGTDSEIITLPSLVVTHAFAVIQGITNDPETPWLVRFADKRCLLDKFKYVADVSDKHAAIFNVWAPWGQSSGSAADYYKPTTNAGTPYTWATMLAKLLTQCPAAMQTIIGSVSLPFTPDGVPENWDFRSVSSIWQAINQFVGRVGCAFAYNPTAATFSIVRVGEDDGALDTARDANEDSLVDDTSIVESRRVSLPAIVEVAFNAMPVYRGTEYGTDTGSPWTANLSVQADRYVRVPYTDVADYANIEANSVVRLYDDLIARQDSTGAWTNSADCETRAAERAEDYYRMLTDGNLDGQNRRRTLYDGVLSDFVPGPICKLVTWHTGGPGENADTTIETGFMNSDLANTLAFPSRLPTTPIDQMVLVRIDDTNDTVTGEFGNEVMYTPNAENMLSADIIQIGKTSGAAATISVVGKCWVRWETLVTSCSLANPGTYTGDLNAPKQIDQFVMVGKVVGQFTSAGDGRCVVELARQQVYVGSVDKTSGLVRQYPLHYIMPGVGIEFTKDCGQADLGPYGEKIGLEALFGGNQTVVAGGKTWTFDKYGRFISAV